MSKTIYGIIIFILINFNIYAQEIYNDTIKVIAGQEFLTPNIGAFVLQNIVDIKDLNIKLYDISGNFIKDLSAPIQKPSTKKLRRKVQKKQGRGQTVWFVLKNTIDNTGDYYIDFNIKVKTEGGYKNINRKYLINVFLPTLAAPFELEKIYFIKQKESFSFATNEFTDPSKYSYTINDEKGTINITGKGAFIKLDSILDNEENYAKKITIKGLYNNKTFSYRDNYGNIKPASEWNFFIDKPSFQISCINWSDSPENAEIINIANTPSRIIKLMYSEKTEKGYIAFAPDILSSTITTELLNEENDIKSIDLFYQENNQIVSYDIRTLLVMNINNDFWDENDIDETQPTLIKLSISNIETQFGYEINNKTWYAYIIKQTLNK